MRVGLRIDVDTFRGTRLGVPNLCRLLDEYSTQATFFFSMGPDNMGRHLRRLLHPAFFWKMLRTRAGKLYGWDILLRGTLWPGPIIGDKLAPLIRDAARAGHEIGLHAWDHYQWQAHIEHLGVDVIARTLTMGSDSIAAIIGREPSCSAAPGWRCNETVLEAKGRLPFAYNSDCRGTSIFRPVVKGRTLAQPQIPVTLPTYDEIIGRNGIDDAVYNEHILSLLDPEGLNVLTIHAEVEGIVRLDLFRKFLQLTRERGIALLPLRELLDGAQGMRDSRIILKEIPGREGWVACQEN